MRVLATTGDGTATLVDAPMPVPGFGRCSAETGQMSEFTRNGRPA